jgi:hypothetical protein
MIRIAYFNKEDRELLLRILHSIQDMWADTENDLAGSSEVDDIEFVRQIEIDQLRVDKLRAKLGDKWKPFTDFSDERLRQLIEEENSKGPVEGS